MPPPPPAKSVPPLSPGNKAKKRLSGDSTGASQSLLASSKSSCRTSAASAAVAQPPIHEIIHEWEDKKQAKRAANRLSAHLSRKRKKMFIDDLKDENVELRRKEQILRSIPDMIVVFDSSGCMSFVSHSVTSFLDFTSEELENTSFWDLLTEDSVRLIKSVFMDALAVKRPPKEDSSPLANGESMTVTLLRRDGASGKQQQRAGNGGLLVSLKGVVHFAGESPECVCSIRPESAMSSSGGRTVNKKTKAALKVSSSSAATRNRPMRAMPLGVPPTHQISDIDSVQS